MGCQGGDGVTVPGGVAVPWGCGTEGRGQWARWAGLNLAIFSSPNDSVLVSGHFAAQFAPHQLVSPMLVTSLTLSGRPKKLTLKGYKPYWCTFKDTSISCYKSKEEANGTPAHQMNLRGRSSIRTLAWYSSDHLPPQHLAFPLAFLACHPGCG